MLDRQSVELRSVARLGLGQYSTPEAIFDYLIYLIYLTAQNPWVSRWLAVKENLPTFSASNLLAFESDLAQSDIFIYDNIFGEIWSRDGIKRLFYSTSPSVS
ncbi:hypothetical protein AC1031_013259 [Aphanomyces cochlioides]|nr:hypothetical protein AC1031_013259 [Aphanomyces cochlioides]